MPRRKKRDNGHDSEQPAAAAPAIGGNVSDETLRQFEREYVALKVKLDEARGKLGAHCKAGESNGIDLKTFKLVRNLKVLLPPEAEAKIQTFTRYTKQLGIFDLIEEFRQGEAREDNAASVAAAERAAAKPRRKAAAAEPKSGGKLEACHAQGFEAGNAGEPRENPYGYGTDERGAWDTGWQAGGQVRAINAAAAEQGAAA